MTLLSQHLPPELFDASGVFETCRVKKGRVLSLEEHLDRLAASLKTLHVPLSNEKKMKQELTRAARQIKEGYLRVALRRRGHPRLMIHKHPGIPYAESEYRRGVSIRTAATRSSFGGDLTAQVKGSERLSGILARLEGGNSFDLLRFGSCGTLTEGTVTNLFLVKEGMLVTPPPWAGVLEGVTRQRVIGAAGTFSIPVKEIPVTRHDLFNAEEVFLTNVLVGILPVRDLDGRMIGESVPGRMTLRLMRWMEKDV